MHRLGFRLSLKRNHFLLVWLVLTGLLLWPAAVNGGAFLFPDTTTYIRGADAAAYKLTGSTGPWTRELLDRYPDAAAGKALDGGEARTVRSPDNVILSGRSIYYGIPLYISDLTGSFWLLIVGQAMLTAAVVTLATRRLADAQSRDSHWLLLGLTVLTPIGLFVGMMMPDFMAALAIIAATLIFIAWAKMDRLEKSFWLFVVIYGLVAHSANLLIVGTLAAIFCALRFSSKAGHLAPVVAALAIGILGELLLNLGISYSTGNPPVRPPFLTARLTADGPGTDFLNAECPRGSNFALCAYRDKLPVDSDVFLWSRDKQGIFSNVSSEVQRKLAKEQTRFLVAVLLDRPTEVLKSSTNNFVDQLSRTNLIEFNGLFLDPAKLAPHAKANLRRTRAAQGIMPIRPLEVVTPWIVLASLAGLLWLCWDQRGSDLAADRRRFVLLLLAGVFINAAVCGMLSKPHDRYQTRILWLVPFAALSLAFNIRRQSKHT